MGQNEVIAIPCAGYRRHFRQLRLDLLECIRGTPPRPYSIRRLFDVLPLNPGDCEVRKRFVERGSIVFSERRHGAHYGIVTSNKGDVSGRFHDDNFGEVELFVSGAIEAQASLAGDRVRIEVNEGIDGVYIRFFDIHRHYGKYVDWLYHRIELFVESIVLSKLGVDLVLKERSQRGNTVEVCYDTSLERSKTGDEALVFEGSEERVVLGSNLLAFKGTGKSKGAPHEDGNGGGNDGKQSGYGIYFDRSAGLCLVMEMDRAGDAHQLIRGGFDTRAEAEARMCIKYFSVRDDDHKRCEDVVTEEISYANCKRAAEKASKNASSLERQIQLMSFAARRSHR
jgi:hypothetical protein